jgi:hypothetical protein
MLAIGKRLAKADPGNAGWQRDLSVSHDRQGLVARQRRRQVALRNLHVADLVMRGRQVALPPGIARVGFGQTLSNCVRRLVARQRRRQIALRLPHVTDPVVRDRQVVLPPGIARVGFGQTLSNSNCD